MKLGFAFGVVVSYLAATAASQTCQPINRMVVYGDSFSEGWGREEAQFSALMNKRLQSLVDVAARSMASSTSTADWLPGRLTRLMNMPTVQDQIHTHASTRSDLSILAAGTADLPTYMADGSLFSGPFLLSQLSQHRFSVRKTYQRFGREAAHRYISNLRTLLQTHQNQQSDHIVVSMNVPEWDLGPGIMIDMSNDIRARFYIDSFNSIYRQEMAILKSNYPRLISVDISKLIHSIQEQYKSKLKPINQACIQESILHGCRNEHQYIFYGEWQLTSWVNQIIADKIMHQLKLELPIPLCEYQNALIATHHPVNRIGARKLKTD